jgi:hypothetical protein
MTATPTCEPELLQALQVAVLPVHHQMLVEERDPLGGFGEPNPVAGHRVPGAHLGCPSKLVSLRNNQNWNRNREDQPKQFDREHILVFFGKFRVVSVFWFHETNRNTSEADIVLVCCFGSNRNFFRFCFEDTLSPPSGCCTRRPARPDTPAPSRRR